MILSPVFSSVTAKCFCFNHLFIFFSFCALPQVIGTQTGSRVGPKGEPGYPGSPGLKGDRGPQGKGAESVFSR